MMAISTLGRTTDSFKVDNGQHLWATFGHAAAMANKSLIFQIEDDVFFVTKNPIMTKWLVVLGLARAAVVQWTWRPTWMLHDGLDRLARWVFGSAGRVDECGPGVLYVTGWPFNSIRGWHAMASNCSYIMFVDCEGTDDRHALKMMSMVPQHVGLLYVGNWRGHGARPPLKPEAVTTDSRSVVRLYWPHAFLSFAERVSPLDGAVADPRSLVRGTERPPGDRYGVVAYMAQNCKKRRDNFFHAVCRAAAHLGPCEALSKCPVTLQGAETRNTTGTVNRNSTDYLSNAIDRYRDYVFVFAVENINSRNGYVSEKIVNVFLAGGIPIATGDNWTTSLFREDAMVFVTSVDDAVSAIASWFVDVDRLKRILAAPKLTELGEQFLLYDGSPNVRRFHAALDLLVATTQTLDERKNSTREEENATTSP